MKQVKLQCRFGLLVDQRVTAFDLLDKGSQLLMQLEALDGVVKQQRQGFMIDRNLAQSVSFDAADTQRIRLLDQPEALDQGGLVPGQRFFQLMGPHPVMVVFQFRRVGVGASRVLNTVLAARVLLDLVMRILERHPLLTGMIVQAQRIGLDLWRRFGGRGIGPEVGVPQYLLARGQRHRFEVIHCALPFDGGQHLGPGGNERYVQGYRCKMRPHLAGLALIVGLDAFKYFVAHLRCAHGQHDRAEPRHHERGEIEYADGRLEKAFQAFEPGLAVLVFGGHGHCACIAQDLADMRLATALPQLTGKGELLHRQARQRRAQRVVRAAIAVTGRLVQTVEPGEEPALFAHRHKAAEEAPVRCAVQTGTQVGHEFATGRILLEGLLRVAGDVHHQRLGAVGVLPIRADQQRPHQYAVEHVERGVCHRLPGQFRRGGARDHILEHLAGVGTERSGALQPGNIDAQCQLLALMLFQQLFKGLALIRVLGLYNGLDMRLIKRAKVQCAAKPGESMGRDRHRLCMDGREGRNDVGVF
ncbi:hypothetical protein SRABI08_04648 [Pseudomonas carnis]|nr:hypothetical protein SRABI08_04648 [Pseudomonas carnis]